MSSENPELIPELLALLADGQKIEAIKRYREQTGAGLAEAKEAVEELERNGTLRPVDSSAAGSEGAVIDLLEQGRKIAAIKLYREQTGAGLKEAKEAVEAIAAERGIAPRAGIGCLGLVLLIMAGVSTCFAIADEPPTTIVPARVDGGGFLVHEVRSPYQAGTTAIRVLVPDQVPVGKRLPVVFVLPVLAGMENRYGDGLAEVKKHDLPNKYQAVFVAPTFSHLPWYADHPTKADIRQETYFLKVVVPFIDRTYPVQADGGGRFLLGFSKSGWGAYSLLLRHPDRFARAAAWDAPMMMDGPGRYGSGDIFGSAANFEPYRIARLLKERAQLLRKEKRLILLGHGNFRDQHQKAHVLMNELGIAHEYRDGPPRKHDWHSGWVAEAAELLLAPPKNAIK